MESNWLFENTNVLTELFRHEINVRIRLRKTVQELEDATSKNLHLVRAKKVAEIKQLYAELERLQRLQHRAKCATNIRSIIQPSAS